MAGLYLHIPFCKKACIYCDFHFSTQLSYKNEMMDALLREMDHKKGYLDSEEIDTIYFGGGTPSLLSYDEISLLLERIYSVFSISDHVEFTLEANPDDLNVSKIKELSQTTINRLSIGIQSFHDKDLKFMNRAHNAEEAERCISDAKDAGFSNISIDIIYASPTTTLEMLQSNLIKAHENKIPHISCYCLTVEPNTALNTLIIKDPGLVVDPDIASEQYLLIMKMMAQHNYDHYEISNFALKGYESRHNSNYWNTSRYLGLGPSAHSYNGSSRQWNISNNIKYIKAIDQDLPYSESEDLSESSRFNEYVLTSLRQAKGISIRHVSSNYGEERLDAILQHADPYIKSSKLSLNEDKLTLTMEGKLIADRIISDLFEVTD